MMFRIDDAYTRPRPCALSTCSSLHRASVPVEYGTDRSGIAQLAFTAVARLRVTVTKPLASGSSYGP